MKSWGKPFPRSCPLKIKDSVMLSLHERMKTAKTNQIVPNSQRLPGFTSEMLSHTMCREERHKHKGVTYLCASEHVPQHSTDHKAHAVKRVRAWERWMEEQCGVLKGHTHTHIPASPSLLSAASWRRPSCRPMELGRNAAPVMGKVPVRMVATQEVTGADRHPSVRSWRRAACRPLCLQQRLFILFSNNR